MKFSEPVSSKSNLLILESEYRVMHHIKMQFWETRGDAVRWLDGYWLDCI